MICHKYNTYYVVLQVFSCVAVGHVPPGLPFETLEPYAGKLACTVLRRRSGRKPGDLSGPYPLNLGFVITCQLTHGLGLL